MGNASVGKTSIINSFLSKASVKGQYRERTDTIQDFSKAIRVTDKQGDGHELTLNIWDAAGDENIHNLAHMFCNGAQVGVLCYAIDDKRSYDQLTDWADHI